MIGHMLATYITLALTSTAHAQLNMGSLLGLWGSNQGQGQGIPGLPSMTGLPAPPVDPNQYQTCTGMNTRGDLMRVTFTQEPMNFNPWGGLLRRFSAPQNLQLSAHITPQMGSGLDGQYKLVVTEFSRVEDGCSAMALGNILADKDFFGRIVQLKGAFKTVTVGQSQGVNYNDIITNLEARELAGRGLALCPASMVQGDKCLGVIPLCCKIGIDTQRATVPFIANNQLFGQGQGMIDNGMGFGGNGMGGINGGRGMVGPMTSGAGNPMNGGMGGPMNGGMGGPMNGGMGGPMNGGMGGPMSGGLGGPMNGGMGGPMNGGMGGPMNGGMGGPMNGGMNGQMGGQMNGQLGSPMNGRDGQMNGNMGGQMGINPGLNAGTGSTGALTFQDRMQ